MKRFSSPIGADRVALVIVAGVDQRLVGQREKLVEERVVLLERVAVLEVGAAGAPDQQRIAGKDAVLHREAVGLGGVARRVQRAQADALDLDRIAVADAHRDHVDRRLPAHHGDALGPVAEFRHAADVVGMDVGIHDLGEGEPELVEQRKVALNLLLNGVDDERLAARAAAQQVGVGARGHVIELAKDHRPSSAGLFDSAIVSPCCAFGPPVSAAGAARDPAPTLSLWSGGGPDSNFQSGIRRDKAGYGGTRWHIVAQVGTSRGRACERPGRGWRRRRNASGTPVAGPDWPVDCAAHFGILRRSPARCTGPWSGAENSGLGQPGFHVDHDLAHRVPAFQVSVGAGGGRKVEAPRVDRCWCHRPQSCCVQDFPRRKFSTECEMSRGIRGSDGLEG